MTKPSPKERDAERVVELPVRAVTVMEDRAQVRRRGAVPLAEGQIRLLVEDVAPVIVDKTLSARILSGAARVGDVRVRRSWRITEAERPEEIRKADARADELRERVEALGRAKRLADGEAALFDGAFERALEELAEDVAAGRAPDETFWEGVDEILRRRETLGLDDVERRWQARELAEELQRLVIFRRSLENPSARRAAVLECEILVEKAGEVELEIEYLVPGACWRPRHEARLVGGRIRFRTEACVWQNTGEDWPDVELAFSTQRASLGAEPPFLADDVLRTREKESDERLEARDQAIESVDESDGRRRRKAPEVPGIDDGGVVQTLPGAERRDLPSDGRPLLVPLFDFEGDAQVEQVMFPERAVTAHLRSRQHNEGAHPILAGPVELLRDSGRVGRCTVLYVAPGAPFELGWGPEAALRVHRAAHTKEEKGGMLSAWNEKTTTVILRLSNLGAEKRDFVLTERIPVSEVESVRVKLLEGKCSSDHDGPDEDGLVSWKVELPGKGRKTLVLAYQMEIRKSVEGV